MSEINRYPPFFHPLLLLLLLPRPKDNNNNNNSNSNNNNNKGIDRKRNEWVEEKFNLDKTLCKGREREERFAITFHRGDIYTYICVCKYISLSLGRSITPRRQRATKYEDNGRAEMVDQVYE